MTLEKATEVARTAFTNALVKHFEGTAKPALESGHHDQHAKDTVLLIDNMSVGALRTCLINCNLDPAKILEDHTGNTPNIIGSNKVGRPTKSPLPTIEMSTIENGWPFPQATNVWKDRRNIWIETNEESYWKLLECLPPEYGDGDLFVVGEAADHNGYVPVHSVLIKVGERYFCKDIPLNRAEIHNQADLLREALEDKN